MIIHTMRTLTAFSKIPASSIVANVKHSPAPPQASAFSVYKGKGEDVYHYFPWMSFSSTGIGYFCF